MTIELTHAAVVQALNTLAQETPDKVNPPAPADHADQSDFPQGCYYTVPDGGHCIAGEVIVRLGGYVPGWGEDGNEKSVFALINQNGVGIDLPPESISLLANCQYKADMGATWGDAAVYALDEDRRY